METQQDSIVFALNGKRVEVPTRAYGARTTLNEYLRSTSSQGTKLSCGQGGCGACTVALSERTADGVKTRTVASCLMPLVQVAGRSVTTVEGLCEHGSHPIQTRIGHYFGSQCGFCTPGMVMQLYGALSAAGGGEAASEADVEKALEGGNLCRCTGYRPILDAARSFCATGTTGAGPTVVSEMFGEGLRGPYDTKHDPPFPEWLQTAPPPLAAALGGESADTYLRPSHLADAAAFLGEHPTAKIISGHTSAAVHVPLLDTPGPVLDVSGIEELGRLDVPAGAAPAVGGGEVVVGAGVTLEDFAEALSSVEGDWAASVARHLRLIASPQVRHRATVGGNLACARSSNAEGEYFPSDLAPLLLALGATVEEWQAGSTDGATRSVAISDWMAEGPAAGGPSVLVALRFPAPTAVFESYRVAARARQCKADLNAAFLARVDEAGLVRDAQVAFGALGTGRACRAPALEGLLEGREVTELCRRFPSVDEDLATALGGDVKVATQFQRHLVTALFVKFLARLSGGHPEVAAMLHGETKLHSGRQVLPNVCGLQPFGGPGQPKDLVELQCNGEALYVDDVAMRARTPGMLHASVVMCKAPPGSKVLSIDMPDEVRSLGATFYGKADTAANEWNDMGTSCQLFAGLGDAVQYWGEPCGVVVAPDAGAAARAAALIASGGVRFSAPAGPALTEVSKVRAMVNEGQDIGELLLKDEKGGRGSASRAFERAPSGYKVVKGGFRKNGQLHWYMEPQVCFVEVDEGAKKYVVSSATQFHNMVQERIAHVLGIDMCRVEVKHRRCGGAFGGKASPSILYACMAALGAQKTGRAVRLVLPRDVDSVLVGGRERLDVEYELLVHESTGEIEAASIDVLAANGCQRGFGSMMLGSSAAGCYMIPNVDVRVRSIRTHSAKVEAVRGPGHHEAALLAETLLDHAAHAVGLSETQVRERNFYRMGNPMRRLGVKFGMIPPLPIKDVDHIAKVFDAVKDRSGLRKRELEVAAFNASHQFRKRGLGVCMTKYGILKFGSHTCLVNIYKDGSVVLHHDGAEIGQGLQTKAIQMARRCLSSALPEGLGPLPSSLVRVADNSTDVVLTGGTAGSVTSEMVCSSIEDACFQLLEKLEGARKRVKADDKAATAESYWRALLAASSPGGNPFAQPAYLSAIGRYSPGLEDLNYESLCAGVVEVEVDGLTGEYDVRHASVIFEAGPLLHGGIEVGQIEGAFIMGLGALTTEQVAYDPETSRLVSDNTWRYKLPTARDVPGTFEVELLNLTEESPQRFDILRHLQNLAACFTGREGANVPRAQRAASARIKTAKATGEPPLCAATAVVSALRHAIRSFGATGFVELSPPVTVEQVAMLCAAAMHAGGEGGPGASQACDPAKDETVPLLEGDTIGKTLAGA